MTELRQRMMDAMVQRGFAQRTQETYVQAIRRMAQHYRRDPATYTSEEVQAYLLHMVKERKLSYSSMNQAACAAQFLFQRSIVAWRTAALGGQQLACDHCNHSHWQYHSCRNRHCPQCGARAKDAWLQGRIAEVLEVLPTGIKRIRHYGGLAPTQCRSLSHRASSVLATLLTG